MADWQDQHAVDFMLDECETWAVVGLADPRRTAYSIAALLQERGKRIVPIHPDAPTVLGEQGYATLAEVPFAIDVVDVFRRSDAAGPFADQAVAVGAKGVWFQLGVIDDRAFERTLASGVPMVMDTCPAIEVAPPARRLSLSKPLVLRPGPGLPDGLEIPEADLEERFSKSSGPGGQSVNTTDSRVEVALDLTTCAALDETQRERAVGVLGHRLVVTASEHRSQHRNRLAARHRLADRLREALAPPPLPRVPTKPTRGSQRRRVEGKRRRSQVKVLRGRVRDD